MEKLSLCRICLATDVRLCFIAKHLRDMYETITSVTFKREDGRPVVACYICHARLQNCYRLRTSCLRSEELLTEMLSSGMLKTEDMPSANTFRVVSVLHFSLGQLQKTTECHIKEEALEVIYDTELKDIVTEAQEELCSQIDDKNQFSHLEDPLDVIQREPDDVESAILLDAEDVKLEIEETFLEENKQNGANSSSQSADDINLKINLKDSRTGIPVLQKRAETNSNLVTKPKNNIFNKIFAFRKLNAANNIHKTNDKIGTKLLIQSDNKAMTHYEDHKQTSKSNICTDNQSCFKWFQCDVCKKDFKSEYNLRKHKYEHPVRKQFHCNVCNKCFRRKSHLTEHMHTHTKERRLQCDVCNKCFRRKSNLREHMNTHTKDERLQCDACNRFLSSKRSLKKHMRTHTDEKQFQCDVCSKYFMDKQYLIQHLYIHTNEKKFKCDMCNECFSSKQNLLQHINAQTVESRFQCDVCNKLCKTDEHLKKQNIHKPFKCDICNKCFRYKHHLSQHVNTHNDKRSFQCNVCNKCFKYEHNLSLHMITHTGELRFQCDVCNKCFGTKRQLTRHSSTHTDKRPFQCEICKKCYKSKDYKIRHMYVHTGELNFQCNVCNKRFTGKHHLARHMNIHTDEKRFPLAK